MLSHRNPFSFWFWFWFCEFEQVEVSQLVSFFLLKYLPVKKGKKTSRNRFGCVAEEERGTYRFKALIDIQQPSGVVRSVEFDIFSCQTRCLFDTRRGRGEHAGDWMSKEGRE